jgi:hypothetical protein
MVTKTHNYNSPQNYICIPLPHWSINKRIRTEGCPFLDCSRYTVAFVVNDDGSVGETITGWPGYSYDCPIIPFWDKSTKWSVLQTDILTE